MLRLTRVQMLSNGCQKAEILTAVRWMLRRKPTMAIELQNLIWISSLFLSSLHNHHPWSNKSDSETVSETKRKTSYCILSESSSFTADVFTGLHVRHNVLYFLPRIIIITTKVCSLYFHLTSTHTVHSFHSFLRIFVYSSMLDDKMHTIQYIVSVSVRCKFMWTKLVG